MPINIGKLHFVGIGGIGMSGIAEVLHELGYQIHCHCNGDLSADKFLDAVEAALAIAPREDHRHTIIHGQTLRDDQLDRMAGLGVTVSFFSAHVYFWGDVHF
jgi:predicted amidohydrolase YtcJ